MSGRDRWQHDFFENNGPTTSQVTPDELRRVFHANQTRGIGDATGVDRTQFRGGISVNVRHRSGSITEFHMHDSQYGSIRHTHRDGNSVEVRPLDQDSRLRDATKQLHGMLDHELSQLPVTRRR